MEQLAPRYNIAPMQPVLGVRARHKDRVREPAIFQWGLVPSWAEDPSIGSRMINARSETVAEKPAFRGAMKYRRCLLPADGFYEWLKTGKTKVPFYVRMKDGKPFAFAGLWESWERATGYLETSVILTTSANELLRPLHERMPCVLHPDEYDEWLDPTNTDSASLLHLLRPFPDDRIEAFPVGDYVSYVANEGPGLIEPRPRDDSDSSEQPSLF